MVKDEKTAALAKSFTDERIKQLFAGQNKALISLFIDTLSFALQRIALVLEQADTTKSKTMVMLELDKLYQSSNYLGIDILSDLVADIRNKITAESAPQAPDRIFLKDILAVELKILHRIADYWREKPNSPSLNKVNEEKVLLAQFSKEDDELQQLYNALLKEYLCAMYAALLNMQKNQVPIADRQSLSDLLLRFDTATNFMNYPQLSELIRECLIAVEDYKKEYATRWLNGISRIYNRLLKNVHVQFSAVGGLLESCKEIILLN